MTELPKSAADLLQTQGVVRWHQLIKCGLHDGDIPRLEAAGALKRIGHGLYALPDYQPDTHEGLILVAKRAPRVVFCLLTALRFHDLTTQAPFQIWIGIGQNDKPPRMAYPPLRVVRYAQASLNAGVVEHTLDHTSVLITDIAKTVADCFKYRHRIGLDVAIEALRESHRDHKLDMNTLWEYAKINRVAKVMRPYLDTLA